MKKLHIKDKLTEIGVEPNTVVLGDFDYIGEFTAKRQREPTHKLYNSVGAFYRANYERGILIYHLIRKFNLTSMLEIGFGRGYGTMCAAKAFYDSGIDGKIYTIDPQLTEQYAKQLNQVFPNDWFKFINFYKGTSEGVLTSELPQGCYDLVYIDGDHRYDAVKRDWELVKDRWSKFVLFDDYKITNDDVNIECAKLIDEIDDDSKELIIMDRRMFPDDRLLTDDQIDYGQVLMSKNVTVDEDDWDE